MAWTEVGNNQATGSTPIQKWQSIGQTIEGVYRGRRPTGKYKPLIIIETSAGERAYTSSDVLEKKLAGVKPGDRVHIEYLGKRKSQSGMEYGDFKVMVDAAQGLTMPGTAHASAADARAAENRLEEFDRLVDLIRNDKGAVIANAMAAAAKTAGDPIKSIREAMQQLGVVSF
jgi:hypothetical protein